MQSISSNRAAFSGIPSFMMNLCRTASKGGFLGYDYPGRELARHIEFLTPFSIDQEGWLDQLSDLQVLAANKNDYEVLQWLKDTYPKIMKLVPEKRQKKFLDGFYKMLGSKSLLTSTS